MSSMFDVSVEALAPTVITLSSSAATLVAGHDVKTLRVRAMGYRTNTGKVYFCRSTDTDLTNAYGELAAGQEGIVGNNNDVYMIAAVNGEKVEIMIEKR